MQSFDKSEDGIVTVSGKQSSDGMHPIGLQLQSLRRGESINDRALIASSQRATQCNQKVPTYKSHMTLMVQVPPLLQETGDPAWLGLQQDLQIMNKSDAGTLCRTPPSHA